jgi:hypothetical protein
MEQNNHNGALQKPLGSGFTASSTASEVLQGQSLAGKVVIITGGYTGIAWARPEKTCAAWPTWSWPSWIY